MMWHNNAQNIAAGSTGSALAILFFPFLAD